jgi:tetratricopeptide (TPR) repeat protein
MTKITKDPSAQAAVLFRTGNVWEEHLGDKNEAILCYQKVMELAPNHFMALRSLERLYSQRERWEDLVKALSREAELRGDEEQSISISLRMAEIIETKLMQKDRAEKMYRTILDKDPDNTKALYSLGRILKVGGKWEELIGILSKIITLVPTPDAAFPIYMEIADICQNKLSNTEKALSFFKEALKVNPTSIPAFEGIKNIYQKEKRWEEMVKVIEEEIMLVAETDKKVILLTEMGKVLDENLGKKKEAVFCYEQVLSLKPDHLPVLEPLANYYVNEALWDKASQCLDKLMSMERDPKKKIGYLSLLGKVSKDGMKDTARASRYYESALAIDPAHMPSLEALVTIYEQNSDFENLAKTLQRAIDVFTR